MFREDIYVVTYFTAVSLNALDVQLHGKITSHGIFYAFWHIAKMYVGTRLDLLRLRTAVPSQ